MPKAITIIPPNQMIANHWARFHVNYVTNTIVSNFFRPGNWPIRLKAPGLPLGRF